MVYDIMKNKRINDPTRQLMAQLSGRGKPEAEQKLPSEAANMVYDRFMEEMYQQAESKARQAVQAELRSLEAETRAMALERDTAIERMTAMQAQIDTAKSECAQAEQRLNDSLLTVETARSADIDLSTGYQQTINDLHQQISNLTGQLKQAEQKTSIQAPPPIMMPEPKPIPEFVFTPVRDANGSITKVTATPKGDY